MDKDEQLLRNIVEQKRKKSRDRTVKLGEVVGDIQTNRISPAQTRFARLTEVLEQVLGPNLASHCKVDSVSAGQLKILADSPSYRTQLRLCSSEIIGQLQQACPRARIKNIKIELG